MRVSEFLSSYQQNAVVCRRSDTLQSAAMLLHSNHIGAMPVVNADGELSGILSERDIVSALAQSPQKLMTMRVEDVMSAPPITCNINDSMEDAMRIMMSHKFRHLPVVDGNGVLKGVLSIRDCLAMQLRDKELEANVLRDSFIAARFR